MLIEIIFQGSALYHNCSPQKLYYTSPAESFKITFKSIFFPHPHGSMVYFSFQAIIHILITSD